MPGGGTIPCHGSALVTVVLTGDLSPNVILSTSAGRVIRLSLHYRRVRPGDGGLLLRDFVSDADSDALANTAPANTYTIADANTADTLPRGANLG